MFGGFNPVPRKPGEPGQKPLGIIQNPTIPPAQKPLGVIADPLAPPVGHPGPLGVLPSPMKPGGVPDVPVAPEGGPRVHEIEAEWTGIMSGWSGYAKAGRELLKRIAIFGKIRISDIASLDPREPDPEIRALYNFHRSLQVSEKAPRITFHPPLADSVQSGYRVIYTMFETEKIHPEMIRIMNERYDECFVPTHWNARTFQESGLKLPIYVMPLGVDPGVYSPNVQPFMPKATLMTGKDAGRIEFPKGFLFISVFQPSFRKGHDVLIKTFEDTFKNDPDAGLVLGTTFGSIADQFPWKDMRSRIWTLNGVFSERQLAAAYKACKIYVTANRGEGFNMPLMEAAAIGLPVIVPRTSVHPELIPEGMGYFFEKDGDGVFPGAEKVCSWFAGCSWPQYGQKSQRQLGDLMKLVKKRYSEAEERARRLRMHVLSNYTWGMAARKVAERIRVLCAR